ncbi:hypothetical protein BDW74DRAFT_166705 [Aspergillus multicolor]|uniref:uncharacterized protein n=1 Tax=Aspergillus multicolor TaxID=41759 RepID=UPI003CCE0ACC
MRQWPSGNRNLEGSRVKCLLAVAPSECEVAVFDLEEFSVSRRDMPRAHIHDFLLKFALAKTHLLSLIAATVAAAQFAAGYLVAPPDTAFPGASSDCSAWMYVSTDSLTCEEVEAKYNITLTQFATWNPFLFELSATCVILSGYDYCVEVNFESTTSSSTTTTATTTTTSIPSPTATDDIDTDIADCTSFYIVTNNDTCTSIASSAGISLAELYAWNPFVGPECDWLNDGMSLCTSMNGSTYTSIPSSAGASGSATTTGGGGESSAPSPTETTSSGNGITTPAPIQTGMVANCDGLYLIVSGDNCATVAANHGISLADFYAWNPAVGNTCAYLDLGDYVCVGVIGASAAVTTTSSSSSSSGNGITTPSPIQTGMVSNCDLFHLVESGDTCAAIAEGQGISLSDFYAWNPAVGTSCSYLGLGDYVCVGIVGSASSSVTATSTTTGNGITTPTPIQTGMVSNCAQFYFAVSGDGCASIAAAEGVTVAEIEHSLWAETYLCVGVL